MTIGIHKFREIKQTNWITGMLVLPFKGKITEYAINTQQWNPEKQARSEERELKE